MTDQTPPEDDGHHENEHERMIRQFTEQYGDLFRSKVDDLEAAARRVGLYIRDAGMVPAPVPTDEGMQVQPVVVCNFAIGDAAWGDRVQNPDQDSTETEFRKMAVEMEKDKFEETKAELERRLREGKDLLGDDEPEAEPED